MKLFDTTIRDGSYAINFKYSCADVDAIVTKLDSFGIEYIEIGHGMGLNASSPANGVSLHTDEEYMLAARPEDRNAKLGFFCIPGIARLEDLEFSRKMGMSFVRVGVNANQVELAKPYIEKARDLGFIVMTNLMKSYAITPAEFAQKARTAEQYGAECVYLVDSAGCMLSEEISAYYDATREISQIDLGFHGHNNLGLAIANSVHAAKLGFAYADASIQGIGRSAGNADLESLVMIFQRMGYDLGIDIPRLLEYGYVLLRDITNRHLKNPLDYICGYSGFHSGYMKHIYQFATKYQVDPLRLIMEYAKQEQFSFDSDLMKAATEKLVKDYDKHPYNFNLYFNDSDL